MSWPVAIADVPEEPHIARHRVTVHDYHRMAEFGVLDADARVELIEGEIIDMAPMGTRHRAAVMQLGRRLERAVGDAAHVSVRLPLRLSEDSEPEPDLALLKPRDDAYAAAMPTGADTLLVVEVADTTLAYDVRVKVPLYARHGVAEVWVLDLGAGLWRRFAALRCGAYADAVALERPGRVALPGLPGCSVDLAGLL